MGKIEFLWAYKDGIVWDMASRVVMNMGEMCLKSFIDQVFSQHEMVKL